jgi:hypothetical protein
MVVKYLKSKASKTHTKIRIKRIIKIIYRINRTRCKIIIDIILLIISDNLNNNRISSKIVHFLINYVTVNYPWDQI